MKLIVGLGNPGSAYIGTRHNIGFDTLDLLAADFNVTVNKTGFEGLYTKFVFLDETVFLLKPQTYMNLSGRSVKALTDYYHIMREDLLVVLDDLALKPGSLRLRDRGSSGGHKGLQNIIECLGSDEFKRIRVGVGEPVGNVVDYVLGVPSVSERPLIEEAISKAAEAIEYFLKCGDFSKTANRFNRKIQ